MSHVSEAGASRGERKQQTRHRLLDAALELIGSGRSFASLSLREITRQAGVTPAAFYRHFHDLHALALALVEEGGSTLRQMLRDARLQGLEPTRMVRSSVEIYLRHVRAHPTHFRFIGSERHAGDARLRQAIRNEEARFVTEMVQDLRQLGLFGELDDAMLGLMCRLVVTTLLSAAVDILDAVPSDWSSGADASLEAFVRQLRLVFLGARRWRERGTTMAPAASAQPAPRPHQ